MLVMAGVKFSGLKLDSELATASVLKQYIIYCTWCAMCDVLT